MTSATKARVWQCTHCATDMPATADRPQIERDAVFCCVGCQTVYAILSAHHLESYYEIKKTVEPLRPALPVQFSGQRYAFLDDAREQQRFVITRRDARELRFFVEGVHCVACLWLLERLPALSSEVRFSTLNFGRSELTVKLTPTASVAALAQLLDRLGYRPHPLEISESSDAFLKTEQRQALLRIGVAAACAGNIMILAVSLYAGLLGGMHEWFRWLSLGLALPVFLYSALPFYKGAWAALQQQRMNIDVPISIALIVGLLTSVWNLVGGQPDIYFDTLTVFVFLLLSTRYLLKQAHQKMSGASQYASFLLPQEVQRVDANGPVLIPLSQVKLGDVVRVLMHGPIPVDGVLLSTSSVVDAHVLSGESLPQIVRCGDPIYAGTHNLLSDIDIRVTALFGHTRLDDLFKTVDTTIKPQLVQVADRIAAWFLSGILLCCCLLLLFFAGSDLGEGVWRALALVIVACPCALALATPLAYTLGLKRAAGRGLLLKSPDVFERLKKIKHVVFDKTGTLTHGDFDVVEWTELVADRDVKALAYVLECGAKHPVGRAIVRYLSSGIDACRLPTVESIVEQIGDGVFGICQGQVVCIRPLPRAVGHDARMHTQLGLFCDEQCLVRIVLGDRLRTEARAVIDQLRHQHYAVSLLSGDQASITRTVAQRLGIIDVHSQQSPESKRAFVRSHAPVLMVGDGANDTGAMAEASVSLAVQGSIETSMRVADVYSLEPGIDAVPFLLQLTGRVSNTVRVTLAVSLAYNALGVTLAVLGLVSPLVAAVLMPISSLSVLLITVLGTRMPRS